MSKPTPCPVSPRAAYVWRGFKSTTMDYKDFVQFLGSVFIPACALLQPRAGLRAYLPTMIPQPNKPGGVPDQTALMFWATPCAHDEATVTLAVRVYQNLHGDAYDMTRSKTQEQPITIAGSIGALAPEQPYYLNEDDADWMLGTTLHLVGARPDNLSSQLFLTRAGSWASSLHTDRPDGVDGALIVCGNDYVAAWIHCGEEARPSAHAALSDLAASAIPVFWDVLAPLAIKAGLWDNWPGLDLSTTPALNIQLERSLT
ncbi:MAG: hypothetical protein JOZ77_08025 [Candidatus Eremiobacteraeota bacterium]|nr:hypothetical protein [Candidatus Eremiobacteraeota bacterium]